MNLKDRYKKLKGNAIYCKNNVVNTSMIMLN